VFSFLQISSSNHSTHLDKISTLILFSHQTLGPLSVLFPSDLSIKTLYTSRLNRHFNNILPSNSGPPKCSIPQISSSKHSTHLDKIPTLILSSHQTLGSLSVLFHSDFFIETLYMPRQNTHINIILPSSLGSTKCSVSFKFLHQIPVQALTNFPTLILSSHQCLGPVSVLFPSDFFIKTL